jgi:hypothetical protein
VGSDYNKKKSLVGNLLRHTGTHHPEARMEALIMEQKIRVIIDTGPTAISGDMDVLQDEFTVWATSMKAPRDMNECSRISSKRQFCDYMCKGNSMTDITHPREIGERLIECVYKEKRLIWSTNSTSA